MNALAAIAKPDFKSEKVTSLQTADDIRKQLQRAEYNSRSFSRRLAKFFKKGSDYDTCEFVWRWLVDNIEYDKEPADKQTAKEIERFIVDGYGDCKHYSTFATGVLNACGIPAEFILVGQERGNRRPNHAYCEAIADGKVVVIDPCRKKKFNDECKHFYKWRYQPIKQNEIMALHYLSGDEIGRTKGAKGRAMRKESRQSSRKKTVQQTKTAVKKAGKDVKKVVDKVKMKVAKVGIAPARQAFLTATNQNALKLGTRLAKLYKSGDQGKADIKKFWEGFGGDFEHLKKAIAKGAKTQISGPEAAVANPGTLAALETAVPIIVSIVALFKKHKISEGDKEDASFDAAIQTAKEGLADNPDVEKTTVSMPENKEVGLVKYSGGGEGSQASFFSPLGLFFKTFLLLCMLHSQNSVLSFVIAFLATYCVAGMIVYPFYEWNWLNLRKSVSPFIELPKQLFYGTIQKICRKKTC